MPSPMMAIATADQAYQTALNAKGFALTDYVVYGGKRYGHADIAAAFDESYQRHRPEFTLICGGKKRVNAKRQRQFEKAVKADVYTSFGISWWTIAFGAVLTLLGGPMGLVIAVVSVLFEMYLSKDLNGDKAMMVSMGCA